MSKGVKYDREKLRWSLVPYESIKETIKVLMYGAHKYPEDDNWRRVPNARERYYNASLRHITSWFHGEKQDPETGLHHLAHAMCCISFLLWFELTGTPYLEEETTKIENDFIIDCNTFKCYECKQDWPINDRHEAVDEDRGSLSYCPTCIKQVTGDE